MNEGLIDILRFLHTTAYQATVQHNPQTPVKAMTLQDTSRIAQFTLIQKRIETQNISGSPTKEKGTLVQTNVSSLNLYQQTKLQTRIYLL